MTPRSSASSRAEKIIGWPTWTSSRWDSNMVGKAPKKVFPLYNGCSEEIIDRESAGTPTKVLVTGHSLGGALATLCAIVDNHGVATCLERPADTAGEGCLRIT